MQMVATGRIAALKAAYLDAQPTICTERAEIYTEVYQKNGAEPIVVKRALALAETLKRMTLRIDDGELIVGNHASRCCRLRPARSKGPRVSPQATPRGLPRRDTRPPSSP